VRCQRSGAETNCARDHRNAQARHDQEGGRPSSFGRLVSTRSVHGTPTDDETFLLEDRFESRMHLSRAREIKARLGDVKATLVLCGHSHTQQVVQIPGGPLIVNPGSVRRLKRRGAPVGSEMPLASCFGRSGLGYRACRSKAFGSVGVPPRADWNLEPICDGERAARGELAALPSTLPSAMGTGAVNPHLGLRVVFPAPTDLAQRSWLARFFASPLQGRPWSEIARLATTPRSPDNRGRMARLGMGFVEKMPH
jgi:Calcineurin-like phosphoesterase superfamily domain